MSSERKFVPSTNTSNPHRIPSSLTCVRHNPDRTPEVRIYDGMDVVIVSGGLFYYLWNADLGIVRIGSLPQLLLVTRQKEKI